MADQAIDDKYFTTELSAMAEIVREANTIQEKDLSFQAQALNKILCTLQRKLSEVFYVINFHKISILEMNEQENILDLPIIIGKLGMRGSIEVQCASLSETRWFGNGN